MSVLLPPELLRVDDASLRNPVARLPVAVVLDTSQSMEGAPIEELRLGLAQFLRDVAADEDARDACDIALLGVSSEVSVVRPFAAARAGGSVEGLQAHGMTNLGEGVCRALDLLDARRDEYARRGLTSYQPWLVLLTDGQPTDDTTVAEQRVAALVAARRLTVFPVAVGPEARLDRLERLAGGTRPGRLVGLDFRGLFRWLSASMRIVSTSRPGARVAMPSPFEVIQV